MFLYLRDLWDVYAIEEERICIARTVRGVKGKEIVVKVVGGYRRKCGENVEEDWISPRASASGEPRHNSLAALFLLWHRRLDPYIP